MNTQLKSPGGIDQSRLLLVQNLYEQYAAMLLGYIFEVVKNRTVAEQYLTAVFKEVPSQIDEFLKKDVSPFCLLQIMTRRQLTDFFRSQDTNYDQQPKSDKVSTVENKFIRQMSPEQQLVFSGAYWQGKTITRLATELNKPEEAIRKILKDCFTIIRSIN
ncbi:sigma-70 family RNA polymerase sigma factor [Mucilaginibacter sp. SP1R1]|uniref:sigma-70 family RNA polymerase sigma factor n=1 Tax=Mucilaginibacter sp. SP1R1 TaxID=2723091 RepID=UPI0016150F43|nr:sigma-70 family RNA polymerase sigma factor [Mucilaginibacter sp. SP1R1]MBB6147853.1 DNA-directed RNA polymerase specialized sigma24 family protein [Mucilaginibacter sp. SP1R1]